MYQPELIDHFGTEKPYIGIEFKYVKKYGKVVGKD